MSIYRLERCKSCSYKRREKQPKKNGFCPGCSSHMYYSDNWYFSYYLHGKKYEKSAGPDKKIAQEAEWKMKISVTEGSVSTPTSWKSGVEELESTYPKLSPKTVEMYQNCVASLAMEFSSSMKLSDITGRHLETFKTNYLKQGLSASSFNQHRATLKRIFALSGASWRFKKSIFTSEKETVRDRFLDQKEQVRLLEACKERGYLYTIVLVALQTGLRKTALLTLIWEDIDFKRNMISKVGKGAKVSHIPMTSQLRSHLLQYKMRSELSSPYLFPSATDSSSAVKDIRKSFKSACTVAGVHDVKLHDLRRSFGTAMLAATGDLTIVQELLSHSDISITRKIYAHTLKDKLHEGMKEFEQYMGGGKNEKAY